MNDQSRKPDLLSRGFRLGLLMAATCAAGASANDPALPPLPQFSKGWAFDQRDGKALYQAICQGCHMADGKGAKGAGAYPALANNVRLSSSGYVIDTILNGRRGMPWLANYLDDAQVAALASYVRMNFGNAYKDTIGEAEVKALRRPVKFQFDD